MDQSETGLFGPESVTWKVNREAVLVAGGGRALILQVAHPLVAAGVEQHSNYDTDPWGRLIRTLDITTKMTFGDRETSAAAARRLQAAHRRVHGVAADGTPYDANDPDLLLWVWATLVESSLLMYTRYVRPLALAEVERFYAEQQRFAVACGVPEGHWPATFAEFMAYFDDTVQNTLRATEDSRRIVRRVVRPSVPLPLRPGVELLNLATIGLLPARTREQFGFGWGPNRERLLGASTVAIRRLLPLLPGMLRQFPAAQLAARRTRAA